MKCCGAEVTSGACPRCCRWPVTTQHLNGARGAPGRKRTPSTRGVRRYQISVKLDEALALDLTARAETAGVTLSAVVRGLIEAGIAHRERPG